LPPLSAQTKGKVESGVKYLRRNVLHHAITINIRGNSYRLKEKLKAGLVRAEETPAS